MQWFLVGRGPLKRGTDHVETGFRLLVLLAILAAVPAALLVGSIVHDRQSAVTAHQAKVRHAVHAVLLADPTRPEGATPDMTTSAVVGWTIADGTQRSATVPVPVTDRAGDRVIVWVGPHGKVTEPPLDAETVTGNAVAVGLFAGLVIPLLGWCLLLVARWVLNGRRARRWEADWSTVEPLWTSRER